MIAGDGEQTAGAPADEQRAEDGRGRTVSEGEVRCCVVVVVVGIVVVAV